MTFRTPVTPEQIAEAEKRILTGPEALVIRRVLSQMPYSGGFMYGRSEVKTLGDVVSYLADLGQILSAHSKADDQRETEFEEYRTAVRGFGTLLKLAGK